MSAWAFLSILALQEVVLPGDGKLSTMSLVGPTLAGPPESRTSPLLHAWFLTKVPSPNAVPASTALSSL